MDSLDSVVWLKDSTYTRSKTHGGKLSIAAEIAKAKTEKKNIDDFILTELKSLRVFPISLDDPTPILANKYLDNS